MVGSEEPSRVTAAQAEVRAAITALTAAFEQATAAIAAIETVEDRQAALELANTLTGHLEQLQETAVLIRRRCVQRIWEAEELSLAGLAGKIGVSKARAQQLVKTFDSPTK